MNTLETRYNFSFTGTSLRVNEMVLVARHKLNGEIIDVTRDIGGGKKKTGRTIYDECNKRIASLNENQLMLLAAGDLQTQKQMAYLAVCKTHAFIRDFVIEVVRDKYLLYDFQLGNIDFVSFYRRKAESHPEMEKLSVNSQESVRKITFKILAQTGIIDDIKHKQIQMQILDQQTIKVIKQDNFNWLKLFLFSDADINSM